jgi:hypothetical protein
METKTLDELLDELKSLNKRKRELNKLIYEHPDNKTLQQEYLSDAEEDFLLACYFYLKNNPDKSLAYVEEQFTYVRFDELGYSREQFYSFCKSIYLKGVNEEKILRNIKSYGTWNNLKIKVDDKMIEISSLFDDHYVVTINKRK